MINLHMYLTDHFVKGVKYAHVYALFDFLCRRHFEFQRFISERINHDVRPSVLLSVCPSVHLSVWDWGA